MKVVGDLFPNQYEDIASPLRSSDFTVFFLCGYLKNKVYQDNLPRTFEALKEWIRQEVVWILLAMLQNVMNNCKAHLDEFLLLNGRHLSGGILKLSYIYVIFLE